MILHYEFGGDDYNPGDDFDYEIDYGQVIEAIAAMHRDEFFDMLKRKGKICPKSDEEVKLLRKARAVIQQAYEKLLSDGDFVTEEIEKDYYEIIQEYFYEEAHSSYIASQGSDY